MTIEVKIRDSQTKLADEVTIKSIDRQSEFNLVMKILHEKYAFLQEFLDLPVDSKLYWIKKNGKWYLKIERPK